MTTIFQKPWYLRHFDYYITGSLEISIILYQIII